MSQCKLWLDNYNGQYYPGSVIQGKVIVHMFGETTLRGIKIQVVCREHTEWIESERHYDESTKRFENRGTLFNGNNIILSKEIILYGSNTGSTVLGMGQHIYPFAFNLPLNIPSTYHCDKGSVDYKLLATVDRPLALDYKDEFIFVVNSPVKLNVLRKPELLRPTSYSDDKTVCCWCCAQGPISMDVELPKRTLVPMETIEIKVRLSNMSNTNIEGVTLELKQRLIYTATDPSTKEKEEDIILVNLRDVGVGAHGENTYKFRVTLSEHVFIPNFAMCHLFKAKYVYKLVAKLPSFHKNLEILMNPEIGHVEVRQQSSGLPAGKHVPSTGEIYSPIPVLPAFGYPSFQHPPNTLGSISNCVSAPSAPPAGF